MSNEFDRVFFVCVGVMYSGEFDVCGVTPSVHSHQASWNVCLTTVGIDTSPSVLYQLSYAVKSVRVGDISEQSLVPSISM